MVSFNRAFVAVFLLILVFCQFTEGQPASAGQQSFGEPEIASNQDEVDSLSTDDYEYDDEFLEVEEAFQLEPRLENGSLVLHWDISDGYYLYRNEIKLQKEVGGILSDVLLSLPSGQDKYDEFFGDVKVYYHQLRAVASLSNGELPKFSVRSQGCADAGLCYPPFTQVFEFNAAISQFEERPVSALKAASQESKVASPLGIDQSGDTSLWLMILFAFLGGTILNLMPCVFPILALKILGLVNTSSSSSNHRRSHGFSYAAGVVFCFVAIASVLLALRAAGESLGWGFQLQTPWVVASLVYLFLVIGQSMSGYVEFNPSWANAGQELTERGGNTGSFFTGMLAVVVASPCTAPFMGAALGFALVQPPFVALLIFAALGLGMAAPFVLLVTVPSLAAILPKPGAWMLTFKEIMAFPLYLTAVWLLWVVGRQTGVDGMAMVTVGCVLIFLALWLWRRETPLARRSSLIAAIAALLLLFGPWMIETNDTGATAVNNTNVYSSERVSALRSEGKPVFVNVTADWCITCLVNERMALSRRSVLEGFTSNNIAYLKGDWTNSDPIITELLNEYGRSGVPLYLLFPAESSKPAILLPQILTPDIVLEAFSSL